MLETIALLCTVGGFVVVFAALIQADLASRRSVERARRQAAALRYGDRRLTARSNPKKPTARPVSNPPSSSHGLLSSQRSSR